MNKKEYGLVLAGGGTKGTSACAAHGGLSGSVCPVHCHRISGHSLLGRTDRDPCRSAVAGCQSAEDGGLPPFVYFRVFLYFFTQILYYARQMIKKGNGQLPSP